MPARDILSNESQSIKIVFKWISLCLHTELLCERESLSNQNILFHQPSSDKHFTFVSKMKSVSTQSENPICSYFSLDTHVLYSMWKWGRHVSENAFRIQGLRRSYWGLLCTIIMKCLKVLWTPESFYINIRWWDLCIQHGWTWS